MPTVGGREKGRELVLLNNNNYHYQIPQTHGRVAGVRLGIF